MNRLLTGMIQVIQEVDTNTGLPICNEISCPTMSAGRLVFHTIIHPSNLLTKSRLTYTWLEMGRPAKIPAPQYITRVQRWIVGKIHDPAIFPTDPPLSVASTAFASGDTSSPATYSTGSPIAAPPTSLTTPLSQLAGQQNDWTGKSSGFPPNFPADVKSIIKQMFRCYAHLYHGHWENPFWHINRHLELNSCFVHFVTVAMYYDLLSRKDMEPLQGLIDIFVGQGVIPREAVDEHST
jgi:Mob1/phocein family